MTPTTSPVRTAEQLALEFLRRVGAVRDGRLAEWVERAALESCQELRHPSGDQ